MLEGKPWAPHKIQGWTPDFVPKVLNREVAHKIVPVTDVEAIETARKLASSEGIFCGISSGGTFAAALKVAAEAPQGSVILAMLPDTAERYLSTVLFEGIPDGGDPSRERHRAAGFACCACSMDARRYAPLPDPFPMWRGGVLHGARVAYETWGTLNAREDNAILLFTGLSPPAHAAASPQDPTDGWWQGMVGGARRSTRRGSSSSA